MCSPSAYTSKHTSCSTSSCTPLPSPAKHPSRYHAAQSRCAPPAYPCPHHAAHHLFPFFHMPIQGLGLGLGLYSHFCDADRFRLSVKVRVFGPRVRVWTLNQNPEFANPNPNNKFHQTNQANKTWSVLVPKISETSISTRWSEWTKLLSPMRNLCILMIPWKTVALNIRAMLWSLRSTPQWILYFCFSSRASKN